MIRSAGVTEAGLDDSSATVRPLSGGAVDDADLDERRVGDHGLQVLVVPRRGDDAGDDLAAFGLVADDPGSSRQIRADRSLQVKDEVWVRLEVGNPASPLFRPRRPADVDSPVEHV